MREPVTEPQWASARELAEGQAPTHTRLAGALGIDPATLSRRAAKEGWQTPEHARGTMEPHTCGAGDRVSPAEASSPAETDRQCAMRLALHIQTTLDRAYFIALHPLVQEGEPSATALADVPVARNKYIQ